MLDAKRAAAEKNDEALTQHGNLRPICECEKNAHDRCFSSGGSYGRVVVARVDSQDGRVDKAILSTLIAIAPRGGMKISNVLPS